MLNVNNPIPGMGRDVDASPQNSAFQNEMNLLTQMMDHTIKNGQETGVVKIGKDTVAFGQFADIFSFANNQCWNRCRLKKSFPLMSSTRNICVGWKSALMSLYDLIFS